MPAGTTVRPQKWSNVLDLYDDGDHSAIWGFYEDLDGGNRRRLGVRWNGGPGELGYPNMAGHPLWHVEPWFVTKQILLSLLAAAVQSSFPQRATYIQNIKIALDECV